MMATTPYPPDSENIHFKHRHTQSQPIHTPLQPQVQQHQNQQNINPHINSSQFNLNNSTQLPYPIHQHPLTSNLNTSSYFKNIHNNNSILPPIPPLTSKQNLYNSNNPCIMETPPYLGKEKVLDGFLSGPAPVSSTSKIFKSLFGSEISEWPYSEESLQKALDLRISQEYTKQEYYRLEKINRIIEVMKLAAISKIPGHLIPCLFDNQNLQNLNQNQNSIPTQSLSTGQGIPSEFPTSPPNSSSPSPASPSPKKHSRGHTISNLSEINPGQFDNSQQSGGLKRNEFRPRDSHFKRNINPMKNFKFGSGSTFKTPINKKRTSLPPKHQFSPSRIGAHAISSLHRDGVNRRSIEISSLRHGSNHIRTLSLPATVSIPEQETVDFHSPYLSTKCKTQNKINEIVIPDLSSINGQMGNRVGTSDNLKIETEDVEKILDDTEQFNRPFLKRKKSIGGSPLKEMISGSDINDETDEDECDSPQDEAKHTTIIPQQIEPKTP